MHVTSDLKSLLRLSIILLGMHGFSQAVAAEPDDLNQSPYVTEFNALDIDGSGSLSRRRCWKRDEQTDNVYAASSQSHSGR